MRTLHAKVATTFFGFGAGILLLSPVANATLKEMKAYKQAFPDAKVKCACCHNDAMPKKGTAELNHYGKAAVAASPNAETFKKLGRAEDFKKK